MKSALLTAAVLLFSSSSVFAHGEPNLKHEHAGDVFQKFHSGRWFNDGVINNGTPRGDTVELGGGGKIPSYEATGRDANDLQKVSTFLIHEEIRQSMLFCI